MLKLSMRFLGIDYGTRRIGLAVSDEDGVLAFPKEIIKNDKHTISKIQEVVSEMNIGGVVMGESLSYVGEENELMSKIWPFKEELEHSLPVPVELENEFMTSMEARKMAYGKVKIDDSAAALILQRFLDKRNKRQLLN